MVIRSQQYIALIQVAHVVDETIDEYLAITRLIKPRHLHLNRRMLQAAGRRDDHRDRHVASRLKRIRAGARDRSLDIDVSHVGR